MPSFGALFARLQVWYTRSPVQIATACLLSSPQLVCVLLVIGLAAMPHTNLLAAASTEMHHYLSAWAQSISVHV